MAEPIRFKFKYLDSKGQETGMVSKKGSFDGETIMLAKTALPIAAVYKALTRFNRLVLVVAQRQGPPANVVIAITSGPRQKLVSAINQIVSEVQARHHLESLQQAGRGHEFRMETCLACRSVVDVTGLPVAPQLYCPFCDAIVTLGRDRPVDEDQYHHCDECRLWCRPRSFFIFYFYFALVVHGYSYQRVFRCNRCMRADAWKMLAANLFFVLGVPNAVIQLCRVYFGGSTFSKAFAGLDKANALALSRKIAGAEAIYDQIAARLPAAAGVHFNHGRALSAALRHEEAVVQYEWALKDCANYYAAAAVLARTYRTLKREADAAALERRFAPDAADAPDAAVAPGAAEIPHPVVAAGAPHQESLSKRVDTQRSSTGEI